MTRTTAPLVSLRTSLALLVCVHALIAHAAPTTPSSPGTPVNTFEIGATFTQLESQAHNTEENLGVVEERYADKPEPSEEMQAGRRYSDGEVQYLLGDFRTASVLFYDLVSAPEFRRSPHYVDSLWYLGDALYQQGNLVGARLYLRQLLSRESKHYQQGLERYLEVAGKLNDFSGIETYISRAEKLSGGKLPDEVAYVYAKWMSKRLDLPLTTRLVRADEVFQQLSKTGQSPYKLASIYFMGVSQVELGHPEEALKKFAEVTRMSAGASARDPRIQDLSHMAMARLLYDLGRYDEAIDRYQQVGRDSEYFPDALYEQAWARVRKQDFDGAKNAIELLDVVAPDALLKPDADLLRAHLLVKLRHFDDAQDTYEELIDTYGAVRDELDALLHVNADPVAYFDRLLARNDKNLDVTALLPPVAVKWATTRPEVTDAMRMANDLEEGRHGLEESDQLGKNVLKALNERGLQAFPALQDGYVRADAVASAVAQTERRLVDAEAALVADRLSPSEEAQLQKLQAQLPVIQKRFDTMPKSEQELTERRARMAARYEEVDRKLFQLGYDLQGINAISAAVQKWVQDNRPDHPGVVDPTKKDFFEQMSREMEATDALQKQLVAVREQIQSERVQADSAISGEEAIRAELLSLLGQEESIMEPALARLPQDRRPLEHRAFQILSQLHHLTERVDAAHAKIRRQVSRRRAAIKNKVLEEEALIISYTSEMGSVSNSAREVIGQVAFDSFRRVRDQFYELVLKADVGIVDVAFSRKADQTSNIQRLSQAKDTQAQELDAEYQDLLKDDD